MAMAACCSLAASAQSVKLNGVYQNNRYTDSEKNHSEYVGWNTELGKSIFIVDNGLYTMTWDGNSLTTPEKEPPVVKADIKGDTEKELWANNFNLMYGNSGAVYVDGKIVTVTSRDEQSTTDEELFRVCKWDATTGNLLDSRTFPKGAMIESAGMSYNPVDGKVYGLFYISEAQLPSDITSDEDYFSEEDDADAGRTDMDAGYCLCTIDLSTMTVTPITPGLYYYNFVTFAINSEGRAFALTSGGTNGTVDSDGKIRDINGNLAGAQLYEFDLNSGMMYVNAIAKTDEEGEEYFDYVSTFPATGYCSQYKRQSACFSKSNPNIMYWNGYFNSGKGINDWGSWGTLSDKEWRTNGKYDTSLYAIDITTGEATRLSNIPERYTFSCLWASGNDPSDGAGIDIINPDINPDNAAFIDLSTSDNGGISQLVELGMQYTYILRPAVGWKVNSVTFNNVDVTAELNEKNMYTTPTITQPANALFVVFEQDTTEPYNPDDEIITGVRQQKAPSNVKILGMQGGIRVEGTTAGDQLQIFAADGRQLLTQKLHATQTNIELPANALYIIKVAGKTLKVRL